MNYPHYGPDMDEITAQVQKLSIWIDQHNGQRHPEAVTWGRIAKVSEEQGEVVSAYIRLTGQNPRKAEDGAGSATEVVKELLDVMLTAQAAVEHMLGNTGGSGALYRDHVAATHKRAGLEHQGDSQKDAVAEAFAAAERRAGRA